MSRRYGTFFSLIFEALDLDFPVIPLESVYDFITRKKRKDLEYKRYREAVWKMKRQGYLKIVEKNNLKFIQLTNKGELEKLLLKADVQKQSKWDGKWRVLIFDIPESSREKRDKFRALLKRNNSVKLHASVFASPYPLNRQAIEYLQETGLMDFVRILKVEEMDDDKDLRKKFHSLNSRP